MTPREAVLLTRYVKACCPQQQFDEYTPDAWFDLLGDLDFEECKQAAAAVARTQPFVAPAEVRGEVKRVRALRLKDFVYVPVEGDRDPHVYLAQYRAQRAAVADGLRVPDPAALTAGQSTPRGEVGA